jgi:hypothetical protein
MSMSAESPFEGELIFAGFGFQDEKERYDDYEGLSVDGKVVLALRGQPPQLNLEPPRRERTVFEQKTKRAAELGAKAILFVNTAQSEAEDKLMPLGRRARSPAAIPVLHVTRRSIDDLLAATNQPRLSDLEAAATRGEKPSAQLAGITVSGQVQFERKDWPSRNVIGLVRGNGPHADQFVVLGGHYDHLGIREGEIYNGADDNASGTAAVIEVCDAISRIPNRDRSLLCMAFTGEEIGLLGSEHYVAHPTVPIGSIMAMINMDMIGRWTPGKEENELAIQGVGTGESFEGIVGRRAKEAGIEYLPDPSAKGPSDHASFYDAQIPSLFFFTGVHSDYHRPGDDVEKVNVAGAAQIASLVAEITLDLLNDPAPPKFAKVESRARISRGPAPSSVVMGIMSDEETLSEIGWRVTEVMSGLGADKAGMKAGDLILSIDGKIVKDRTDFFKATQQKKPGDVVPVLVRRGQEDVTLQVELTARP